jgi:prophage antirepressor-like protein
MVLQPMGSALIPFTFEKQTVRIVDEDGKPWFVAADVARVLGYKNPQDAVRRHCKGVRETRTPSIGGDQITLVIPEGDVYRLMIRSKLPEAQRFERWLMDEVLPQLRQTGSYGEHVARVLNDPAAMRGLLLGYSERVLALAPKAAALDRIAGAEGSLCVSDAAKALQLRPKDLFDALAKKGWIFRRGSHWIGYAARTNSGHLEHKITTTTGSDGTERVHEQVRITPRGLAVLAEVLAPQPVPANRSAAA